MDLIAPHPVFNLYNDRWPVYTHRGAEPPAKVSRGPGGEPSYVDGSLLCEGSIVSGAHVERSIIAPGRVRRPRRPRHRLDPLPGRRGSGPAPACTAASSTRTCTSRRGIRIGLDAGHDRERFTVSDDGITVIEKDRRPRPRLTHPSAASARIRPPDTPMAASTRMGSGAGELGDDGGEGVDVVAADDDVAEAELLAPAGRRSSAIVAGAADRGRTATSATIASSTPIRTPAMSASGRPRSSVTLTKNARMFSSMSSMRSPAASRTTATFSATASRGHRGDRLRADHAGRAGCR